MSVLSNQLGVGAMGSSHQKEPVRVVSGFDQNPSGCLSLEVFCHVQLVGDPENSRDYQTRLGNNSELSLLERLKVKLDNFFVLTLSL